MVGSGAMTGKPSRRCRLLAPALTGDAESSGRVHSGPRRRRVLQATVSRAIGPGARRETVLMRGRGATASTERRRRATGLLVPAAKEKRRRKDDLNACCPEGLGDWTSVQSEGSTSEEKAPLANGQKVRRREKLVEKHKLEGGCAKTFLEDSAVREATLSRCRRELLSWRSRADSGCKRPVENTEVGESIVNWLNELFERGHQPARGDVLLAALLHRLREFGRFGGRHLPRAWRALRLVATQMRPAEPLGMKRGDRLPPTRNVTSAWHVNMFPEEMPLRSKTYAANVSVELARGWAPWLPDVCEKLARGDQNAHVALRTVAEKLGKVGIVPYRHSGPSGPQTPVVGGTRKKASTF